MASYERGVTALQDGKLATFLDDTLNRRHLARWARETYQTTVQHSAEQHDEQPEIEHDELSGDETDIEPLGRVVDEVDRLRREDGTIWEEEGLGNGGLDEEPESEVDEGVQSDPELYFVDD